MTRHTQLDDNIGGDEKFQEWKYRIFLILKQNYLDYCISNEFLESEGDEANATHKKKMVKAKRIIADSKEDNLIPHVSSLKTPKEVFDSLTKLFKGNNVN